MDNIDFEKGRQMGRAIHSQNRIAAKSLGVEIELTPEETGIIAAGADIPPVSDGVEWKPGLNLADGTIVKRNGKNYIVNEGMGHISQAGWAPESTPALFSVIKEDYATWSQPQGGHDAYMKGDKVSYNDKLYESTVDYNVYAPGVVAGQWKEI